MRYTEFWSRMDDALGSAYSRTWADTHVLGRLGSRTVNSALSAGEDPKTVWRAVWEELELPAHRR